jgi:hypothetical protein
MRTVRLLLGDGELCIQAFCRGEIHRFVDSGSVFEGGYVRLDKFVVRFLEVDAGNEVVDDGVGDPERLVGEWERIRRERMGGSKKAKGKARVVYLVVGDMVTVGWNEDYMRILKREKHERERQMAAVKEQAGYDVGDGEEGGNDERGQEAPQAEDYDDEEGEEVLQQLIEKGPEPAAAPMPEQTARVTSVNNLAAKTPNQAPKEDIDDPDYISDSDSAFETLTISAERATQRRVHVATATADPRQQLQQAIIQENQQQHHQPHPQQQHPLIIARPRPWLPTSATQPVKLTPLASIPHLPYRQNWMINVLAIVVSLSAVEPSHMAPSFRQRTARLVDMSTPKHIHLTVYLDPEEFLPEVGSVVLLLGVKNHLFEGGSLRKYVSDGLVGGGRWWVQRVDELGWCRAEVGRLRAWWEAGGGGRGG